MVCSLLLLLVSQSAVDVWIEELSSPYPQVRVDAAQRLLDAGEKAAEALERRTFDDPEARVRAFEILRMLRTPRAVLRVPRVGAQRNKLVVVQLIVRNPRPEAVRLEPFAVRVRKRVSRSRRWTVTLPREFAKVTIGDPRLREALVIPAHADAAYEIPLSANLIGRAGFDLRVSYDGDDFTLDAKASIRVGNESLDGLREQLYSRSQEEREDALVTLRYELRTKRSDPEFGRLLRIAARSPYREVRIGTAEAIGAAGRRGDPGQIEAVCALLLDRDLGVARTAHAAFARICPPETDVAAAHRAVAKAFARPSDARSRFMAAALASWTPRDRRVFLAGVLEESRAPIVHKGIASLLRREGIPLEPGAAGLVPRSQIRNLRR